MRIRPIRRSAATAVSFSFVLALSAVVARARADDEKPPGPVLVTKGDDFLVHAVPYPAAHEGWGDRHEVPGGHMLLHTKPSTGEMKALVATGTTAIPTRRLSYHHSRLAGVVADVPNDLLWVLTWSVRTWDTPPNFEGEELRGRARGDGPDGFYNLQLLRLSDGQANPRGGLGSRELKGGPGGVPAPTVGKGALEIIEGGVSVFGRPVKFKDPSNPAGGLGPLEIKPVPEPAEGEEDGARLRSLIEQLKEPHEYARGVAVAQLEELGDPSAIEPLIALIDDRRALPGGDNWVGAAAVRALAKLTDNKGPVQSFEKEEWEAWWHAHRAEYLKAPSEEK